MAGRSNNIWERGDKGPLEPRSGRPPVNNPSRMCSVVRKLGCGVPLWTLSNTWFAAWEQQRSSGYLKPQPTYSHSRE